MGKNSVKNNFIYNVIYQILILIIPLITAPYVARIIGAEGVGTYSYTYSIVYYFMLFCLLGVNNYGNRSIAKVRDDSERLSHKFWSIYLFQVLMGILMIVLYLGYVFFFRNRYMDIALIEVLFVVSAMIDINWLYFGLEKFKMTITRSTIVKILSVLLIFLFVKDSNDLWKYTLIMAGTTALSQLMLWGFVGKYIKFVKVSFKDIISNIKPNLVLFIPVIAISLYKMMDKIMLGSMADVVEVGYYENAEKIISIPLALITALGTVMLPRMSYIVANSDMEKINEYIKKSIGFVMFMSFAMCFGLISIGYNFAPMYFGQSFQKTGILIMMLAITLPFMSFANVIRTQYLIPNEKDKSYMISVSLGAVVNMIFNIILIPRFESIGACIGTIFAEIAVATYQTWAVKKELNAKEYIKILVPFFIKSIIMFIVIYPLNYLRINRFLIFAIQIMIGCLVYGILNIKYIDSLINLKKILIKFKILKKEEV